MQGKSRPRNRRPGRSALVHANDNAAPTPSDLGAATEIPANDNTTVPSQAANDNDCGQWVTKLAANDNEIAITDDLPRPLPVVKGEADMIRQLLGKRFRDLLRGGQS